MPVDTKTIEAIEQKMPHHGMFAGETMHGFLGRHGGYIYDGQLKNLFRDLSAEERALFAENFGLTKTTVNGKIRFDGDLQTEQSVAARHRRLAVGCCPIHAIPLYQNGSWAYYDADGNEVSGDGCEHCEHCKALAGTVRYMTPAKCLVCSITARLEEPAARNLPFRAHLDQQFLYLLQEPSSVQDVQS
jgi:hypothetical protein